jgi:uncharacterized membrane protein
MQNPPPGQQNYGTPTGAPPPAAPSSGSGMDPNIAGAISYIWIVGVVFFIIEKENKFVRFHAMQSILFGIANTVILIVLMVVAFVLTFVFGLGGAMVGGGIGTLISMLVWLIWLLFWVIAMVMFIGLIFTAVKAYQGQKFKLPIIGNIAEGIVEK